MAGRIAVLTLIMIASGAASAPASSIADSLLTLQEDGRPDLVVERAGPAIDAARASGDSTALMNLLLIRGATRAGIGQARQAEPDLRESARLATALGDSLARLRTTRWLGVSVGLQGRFREAADLYAELEDRARAADDSVHLGWAWVGLAYDHYLSGRPGPAAEHYARAAGVLERHGEGPGAMWAWNGRGMVLRQSGRYDEARDAFEHVVALASARGDRINEATALDNLGRLDLQLGDPGLAEERFSRSAQIHRANQSHREGLVPCIDLAQARAMQGRTDTAASLLDSVLTVTRELGLRDLEVLASGHLADLHLAHGRPGAAAALMRQVIGGGDAPSVLADTESRLRLADAIAARDSTRAALTALGSIGSPGSVLLELRVATMRGRFLLEMGEPARAVEVLTPAVQLARESGEDVQRVLLLTCLGQARARLGERPAALADYFEAVELWEEIRSRPADAAWRELRGVVAGSLFAEAAALLIEEPERVADAWALVARYRARTLQERMHGPAAIVDPPSSKADLRAFREEVLRPGEVWIEVVEGRRCAVIFCITGTAARAERIAGRDELLPRMRRLGDVIASPDLASDGPATSIARALLDTWPTGFLETMRSADHVLVCPDGAWNGFPLALADPGLPVSRVPAATVLADLRSGNRRNSADTGILAFTGPDPRGSGMLPGAVAEVRWLKKHLAGVRSPEAPGDTDRWNGAGVLHFAAHTELAPYQPWNARICLGDERANWIRASSVADLDLAAKLVVLTGCTTAGSAVLAGEGMTGLTSAFLVAGAPTVVATLWPVDDAAALRFSASFYEGLADGLEADAALRRARNECRNQPELSAPRHWAGFVLVGEGTGRVPVRHRPTRWPLSAGLLGIAALIILYYRRD